MIYNIWHLSFYRFFTPFGIHLYLIVRFGETFHFCCGWLRTTILPCLKPIEYLLRFQKGIPFPECVKFIKKSILKCKFSFLGCLAILFIETYFDFLIF